jgi:cell division septum initiation protein DivIVA
MTTTELDQVIAALEDLIATSPRMPVTDLALVREQDLVELLARMRASLPESAVKAEAWRTELEAIRTRAHDDADEILLRAQDEVERLVHDPHLQHDARQRADEALREAQAKAESIRSSADAFYSATLGTFAEHLQDLDTVLERNIEAIREGIDALRERTAAAHASHNVPLEPERPLSPPGSIQVERPEPTERSAAAPESRGGLSAPAAESPPA